MGWGREARRVRDATLPLGHRFRALQVLVSEHHHPLGYHGTLSHLEQLVGVGRTFWGGRPRWTHETLLAACVELERSRDSHLAYREELARRRRAEKAAGQRVPTAGDLDALRRPEWTKDLDEARVPGTRERRAAARLRP